MKKQVASKQTPSSRDKLMKRKVHRFIGLSLEEGVCFDALWRCPHLAMPSPSFKIVRLGLPLVVVGVCLTSDISSYFPNSDMELSRKSFTLQLINVLINPPMPRNVNLKLKVNSLSIESESENGVFLYLYLLPRGIDGLISDTSPSVSVASRPLFVHVRHYATQLTAASRPYPPVI